MIDERKIKEAAWEYEKKCSSICRKKEQRDKKNGALFSVWNINADVAFKDGAHWAIQEFLKDLWHPVSEEPSRYDDYLVITKQGCIDSCYFDADSWHDPKIGGGNVTMWLDYKDILPKQKGDKND